ncbi:MAG: efflux RND transporter permease subunit [candidate division WOR-3 bacterium]
MGKFPNLVIKCRIPIIFVVSLLTFIFGYFIKDLKINSDFSSYLPKSDQIVRTLNYISEKYSGKHIAMVALESNEIFTKETIERINYLTSNFRLIDGVSYVTSLTNILDIKKTPEGIEIAKLIDEYNLPTTEEELKSLKNYTLSKDMYKGRIVSEDSRAALIICRIRDGSDEVKIAKEIKKIVEEANIEEKVYYAGYSFNILEVNKIILKDLRFLLILSLLIIVIVLFLSYHSFRGVILPILSVLISIIWVLGVMNIFKIQITLVTNVIPIILIAVGSAYCIHVICRVSEDEEKFNDRINQIKFSLNEVALPIFLAAITTMIGFISFIFGSYLTVIRDFGILSAFGILFSFIISVTFVPSLLSFLPVKNTSVNKSIHKKKSKEEFNLFANMLGRWILKNKKPIVIIGILICLFSASNIITIKRSSDMTKYFKSGSEMRKSSEMIRNKFYGDLPVYFLIKGDIQEPKVLNEMKKLQEFIKSQKYIYNPQSIVDIIEEMNDVIGEGKKIPDSKEKIENLWFLIEGQEMIEQLVSQDKKEAIIQATMSTVDNPREMDKLDKNIQEYISKNTDSSIITIEVTGIPFIYQHMDRAIIRSQLLSLIIAIIFVFICMILLQRSFVEGFIGIIPIVLTLLILFGFMGFLRIPLNLATVLVGSISIGIGIDYPIHFTNRFRKEFFKNRNEAEALNTTLNTVGKAILINVLTVTMGFLVLVMSNLVPLQHLGILIAITMLSSGTATLTILPAIILLTKEKWVKL